MLLRYEGKINFYHKVTFSEMNFWKQQKFWKFPKINPSENFPLHICFKKLNGEWHAVLIDLDHCMEVGTLTRCTQNSLMYSIEFNDNCKCDWRQFSLLLSRVIEGSDHNYHTRDPVFQDTNEGNSLKRFF